MIQYVSNFINLRESLGGVCLSVLESILESDVQSVMKYNMLENCIKRSHGLPKLALGLTKIPGHHETLSIVRHVGLHVDFPFMKSSLGL